MTFDAEEYNAVLEDFLIDIQEIPQDRIDDLTTALEPLCQLLAVGKIEIEFFRSVHQEIRQIGTNIPVYSEGEVDKQGVIKFREHTMEEAILCLWSYPKKEQHSWDENEQKKIRVLGKTLLGFFERYRDMKMAEEYIYQDTTLGIYNFRFFSKIATKLIERGTIAQYTACYFNLRRFSIINQQYGRDMGTNIMRAYVLNLQKKLGANGYVCRVNGDTFAAIFLKERLEMVMDYLKKTKIYYEQGSEAHVSIESTVGYYEIPSLESCKIANDIIDRATAAFHMAAKSSHETYAFFDDELMRRMAHNKKIEMEFQDALLNKEFMVYYQPKVNIKNYSLAGAEALCRWQHDGELIMPYYFIPVLEQSNAICDLDFYMLDVVCTDLRRWIDEGKKPVRVSVNFSRQHMGDKHLSQRILEIVDRHNIPHKYIEIELTETTTDVSFAELSQLVAELQKAGIRTSVDDFGVGYSSLNLIREIPWDVLKVDKSFLPDTIEPNNQKYVMFKYLIALAQNLGLECIVEGVETVEQIRVLKGNNCFMAQGYYFDRPLPKEEFETRMQTIEKAM